MPSFYDEFPNPEIIFELEPEELAAKILFYLHSVERDPRTAGNDLVSYENTLSFPTDRQDLFIQSKAIGRCISEAWSWLEVQGLLIPEPGSNGRSGWRFLSKRAKLLENDQSFQEYYNASKLPKELLHEKIRQRVWSAFVRGEYDTAVFHAMKAVEVYVRGASGLNRADRGVPLMRKAFHSGTGHLTDKTIEEGERDALGHLFAGVFGYFRNPNAHHEIEFDSPGEAMEIVLLANHLLRIVDAAVERLSEQDDEE